jgi:hypothetical protein
MLLSGQSIFNDGLQSLWRGHIDLAQPREINPHHRLWEEIGTASIRAVEVHFSFPPLPGQRAVNYFSSIISKHSESVNTFFSVYRTLLLKESIAEFSESTSSDEWNICAVPSCSPSTS